MSHFHRVAIRIPEANPTLAEISVDGVPLRGVIACHFTVSTEHLAQVHLTLYADLDLDVTLPSEQVTATRMEIEPLDPTEPSR